MSSNNKIAEELAKAIQEKFKDFQFKNEETFADDLKDYVDSGEIFSSLSKESMKEILSYVKTEKTEEGANLIK
jgi:hypothetical protein